MSRQRSHPDEFRTHRRRAVAGAQFTEGTHADGGVIPWHTHEGPTLCFVLRGAFTEYSAGRAADCRPSSLKCMPAGERHWNRFHLGDVHGFMAELDATRYADEPSASAALARQAQFLAGPEVTVARRIHAEFRRWDTAAPLAIEGLLLELVALLARSREQLARGGAVPAWAHRARELVHAHATRVLTLDWIAGEVGVHPATLARGFRRAWGCSIGEMQRQLRLGHAMDALAQTDLPITAVALDAGFFDQSHFTAAFRQAFGTTPARYRRDLRS